MLLLWQAPNPGTSPISKYTLQQSLDDLVWTTMYPFYCKPNDKLLLIMYIYEGSELSRNIANLLEGTKYYFRIAASNNAGTGNYSTLNVTTVPLSMTYILQLNLIICLYLFLNISCTNTTKACYNG